MAFHGNASIICINSVLPDEIIEDIISKLPLASIIRARLVCKTWNRILRSASFLHKLSASSPSSRKSWYVSLRCGRAYDLALDSWWNLNFPSSGKPCAPTGYPKVAFSPGLVCLMAPNSNELKICVFNPITRFFRKLPDFPVRLRHGGHRAALSMSAGSVPGTYIIVVITMLGIYTKVERGTQVGIHVCSSEKLAWETREDVFLPIKCDWGEQTSVICDEVLYFQCRNFAGGYFVCAHDLFSGSCLLTSSFEEDLIPRPCEHSLLMNMRGKLAMVGLSKESVKVRLLDGKEWIEVATVPREYVESSSSGLLYVCGFDEIIYLHDPVSEKLGIFDMATRRCRLIEGLSFASDGTYFEPRFDAIP